MIYDGNGKKKHTKGVLTMKSSKKILAAAMTLSLAAYGTAGSPDGGRATVPVVAVLPSLVQDGTVLTDYGTMDWTAAADGYVTFTAAGQDRVLPLQGPTGAQSYGMVPEDETVRVGLTDGTGRYQFAIADRTGDGNRFAIQYKNSFTADRFDTDLPAVPAVPSRVN